MSTIEKLSIQGIRSFGCNAEDVQSIVFASPVTLILGENGCGKTTIIECLKYALTGESPPGSDRGKNFVHDPKIYGLSDCLGQIKLQVRNIRKEQISVCRSMKITNRRGKYSFETLDATINYLNDTKEQGTSASSISKRCIDVDAAMCQFMGVSKAIINNVLFCHQEDSSWPLDEAKKLKEKFDAIFGITEYNKAIEKIIKMRKEELDDLKVKDSNLRLLAHLKQEMEDKSMCLQKAEEKCDNLNQNCIHGDIETKSIDDRLVEIHQIEKEVDRCEGKRLELEIRQKNVHDQSVSLQGKIKKHFAGTVEDLDKEICSFTENMKTKKIECRAMDKKLDRLKSEEKESQKRMIEFDKKLCMLNQQHQMEKECNIDRAEKLKSLCDRLDISHTEDISDDSQAGAELVEKIDSILQTEQKHIETTIAQHDQNDQQRQKAIDTIRVTLTKLEEGISAAQRQKQSNEKEYEMNNTKIGEIDSFNERLTYLQCEIEQLDKAHKNFEACGQEDKMRDKVSQCKVNVGKLQTEFRLLDERLSALNSITKVLTEISLKTSELEKKEHEVRRIKNKHSDNLKKYFSNSEDSNYRRTLQTKYENIRRELKKYNENCNKLNLKEQSYKIQLKNLKEKILKCEKELAESNEQIYEQCRSTPYVDMLEKSKSLVSKYQLEHGSLLSSESMYKRYIQKLEDDPLCPLCHKNMSLNEATDLKEEICEEIDRLPDNIKTTEELLKIEQQKFERLLHLKPVMEKVTSLEADIPKYKNELKAIESKLFECTDEIESLQLLLAESNISLDVSNKMMGDMSILDETLKEISLIKKNIENLKNKVPESYDTTISLDDLQSEKNTISERLESERKLLEDAQLALENIVNTQNKFREKRNLLKDEQFKLQESVQSLPQLKIRQKELDHLLEVVAVEIVEFRSKIPPLKEKLISTVAEKDKQKDIFRLKISQLQTKLDSCKNAAQDIKRLNSKMLEFQQLNLAIEIERSKNLITECKRKISEKTKEITQFVETLDAIKMECLNHEAIERDLKDNRELKLLQQKEAEMKESRLKLSKQLESFNFSTVSLEKNELLKKRNKCAVRKGELLGQISEIKSQINKLKREIEEPKFKDSIRNYRRAYYEVEMSRRITSDLGKYRVALEWSLIQFHAEKMKQINRLIREYWRLIYRGNDIDYIQIQTDEINTDSLASERRRNYNYRVIQSKNNSVIEMRGRCSAGQRVLASLIIRMALAETFSSNCGVLALDEPTTNLDRMNIMSLCDALNRIIEDRQTQTNFMIIIITHDEDFISALGKIDYYHRVQRNSDCKSLIRKVKIA